MVERDQGIVGDMIPVDLMAPTTSTFSRSYRAVTPTSVPCAACMVAMSASSVGSFDTPAAAAPGRMAPKTTDVPAYDVNR